MAEPGGPPALVGAVALGHRPATALGACCPLDPGRTSRRCCRRLAGVRGGQWATAPARSGAAGATALIVGGGVRPPSAVTAIAAPATRRPWPAERRLVPLRLGAAVAVGVGVALPLSMTGRADPGADVAADGRAEALDPIEAVDRAAPASTRRSTCIRVERGGTATPSDGARRRSRVSTASVARDVTLRQIGHRLAPDGERTMPVGVEFLTDDLDLVALPGDGVTLDVPVETDVDSCVVRTVDRPAAGRTRPGTVDLMADPVDAVGGDVATRPVDDAAAAAPRRLAASSSRRPCSNSSAELAEATIRTTSPSIRMPPVPACSRR